MIFLCSRALVYICIFVLIHIFIYNDCVIIANADWLNLYVFESVGLEGGKTFTTVMFVMYVYLYP